MSQVRSHRTIPEEKVAQILRKLRIRYRRNVERLPGRPDFVLNSAKTVIFVHGCFWHSHPECNRAKLPKSNRAFWKRKISRNKKRDVRVIRLLRKMGWHVITIWQCRLRKPEQVAKRLNRMFGKYCKNIPAPRG